MTNAKTTLTKEQKEALAIVSTKYTVKAKDLNDAVQFTKIDRVQGGEKAFNYWVTLGTVFGKAYQEHIAFNTAQTDKAGKKTAGDFDTSMMDLVLNSVKADEINYSIRLAGYTKNLTGSKKDLENKLDTEAVKVWYSKEDKPMYHPKRIVDGYTGAKRKLEKLAKEAEAKANPTKPEAKEPMQAEALPNAIKALKTQRENVVKVNDEWFELASEKTPTFSPARAKLCAEAIEKEIAELKAVVANLNLIADQDAIKPGDTVKVPKVA